MVQGGRKRGTVRSGVVAVMILAAVLLLGGVLVYMYIDYRNNPPQLFRERRGTGTRLLGLVHEFDIENSYPQTPEEVIELYILIYQLIHGRFVQDEELLRDLLIKQRMLFSEAILGLNSFDAQFAQLLEDLQWMHGNAVYVWEVEVGSFFESDRINAASVNVTKLIANSPEETRLFFNYFLVQEEGLWKIHSWQRVDRNFRNPWEPGEA